MIRLSDEEWRSFKEEKTKRGTVQNNRMDILKRQQGGKMMKDSELRMIETMLKKQDELNSAIMKEFGLTTISKEQIDLATLDEIGEFTHELKGLHCMPWADMDTLNT